MESTLTEFTSNDTGPFENVSVSNVNFSEADITISSEPERSVPKGTADDDDHK
jgi:hypothetical protein